MKIAKEIEKTQRQPKETKPARPVDVRIFARLVSLRSEIAKRQSVPAYVVFSDSTLTDMCIQLPSTKEELLQVSGVGQVKLERYGDAFLEAIAQFIQENGHSEADLETVDAKEPLHLDNVVLTDEPVTVSVIADRLNCLLIQHGLKRFTGAKINTWLMEQGHLHLQTDENGRTFKLPTLQGKEIGICTQEREIRGSLCQINLLDREAQRFVVEGLIELLENE